jgi:hypothetical protein
VSPTGEPLPPDDADSGRPAPDRLTATAGTEAPARPPAQADAGPPAQDAGPGRAAAAGQAATQRPAGAKTPGAGKNGATGKNGASGKNGATGKNGAAGQVAAAGEAAPERAVARHAALSRKAGPGHGAAARKAAKKAAQDKAAQDKAAQDKAAQDKAAAGRAAREKSAPGKAATQQAAAREAATQQAATQQAAAREAAAQQDTGQQAEQQAPTQQAAAQRTPGQPAPAQQAPTQNAAAQQAPTQNAAAQQALTQQAEQQAAARNAVARQASGPQARAWPGADGRAVTGKTTDQAAAREAAASQAQQAAARRAADEAAVERAARRLARKSAPGRNRRLTGLAAALVLAIGGVAAGFAFAHHSRHHNHLTSSDTVNHMVANRDHAAAWIAHQVSPGTVVTCDPVTCVVVESHGFPASHVRALAAGQASAAGSDLVVATPAVRRQFGARLASVIAPGVLATFGSGPQQISIRIVAPRGVAAYRAGLRADLQNRRMSGAGLSGSNRIQAPTAARRQLAAGQVDSRLMITLALMASLHPVQLAAFGAGGPDPAAAPFRSAKLTLTTSAQKQAMLEFLSKQRPPYAPAHVTTRQTGPDRIVLVMEFAAPSPVGLFH